MLIIQRTNAASNSGQQRDTINALATITTQIMIASTTGRRDLGSPMLTVLLSPLMMITVLPAFFIILTSFVIIGPLKKEGTSQSSNNKESTAALYHFFHTSTIPTSHQEKSTYTTLHWYKSYDSYSYRLSVCNSVESGLLESVAPRVVEYERHIEIESVPRNIHHTSSMMSTRFHEPNKKSNLTARIDNYIIS